MKGKRYKEEQILSVLKELEGGKAVAELCREHGVSEPTLYRLTCPHFLILSL